jgi:3-hydroxyacyl-CoA dehydrogenase/enoyl-CoA hydratase/3-hydroxybutyryl-CoA epimerase
MEHWTTEKDGAGIVWLRLDKTDSSANVLSTEVMTELNALADELLASPPRGVVVYSGKKNGFVMGADINEFTSVDSAERAYEVTRQGQQVFAKLESLACPTVAVTNGFALGGGLELAMALDYRVALAGEQRVLGLPEVRLGLHPGFGGTVRAVRICGVRPAMQLMLTGSSITVEKGRKIGLIDRIATPDTWRQAAGDLIDSRPGKRPPPLLERCLSLPLIRRLVAPMLIAQVASRARKEHYPAPYSMIELWVRYGASPKSGYEAEARSFAKLMCSSASRNLVRVFFLQNRLKSQGAKTGSKIDHVHVVGAGVMGGDIAAWCALRGLTVTLQDREEKFVSPAIERAAKLFGKKVRDDAKREATAARLQADVEGAGVARADLVIEAIFEDRDAKKALYADLVAAMKPGAVLATNTSSIRLEDLRAGLPEPTRFVGLHFFNPVAQLPLVEVIRCDDTDTRVLDTCFAFVKSIGKLPLECRSAPGFVVNRILAPYMLEAMHLAEEGVALADIDRAAEQFGMPMGPVELADTVGIDVAAHVAKVLDEGSDQPVPPKLAEMIERGDLGRKTGRGFYAWVDGKAQKPSSDGAAVPDDMEDRLALAMVNEAVACLADKVVADSDLLDAGVIMGTGFAPFRGGPIHYARERGIDKVTSTLERLARQHGDRFDPHPYWDQL